MSCGGFNEILVKCDSSGAPAVDDDRRTFLRKALASAHLNVLLGSAFSIETVPTLDNRESWFQAVDERLGASPADSFWGVARALLRAEYFYSIMAPLKGKQPTGVQLAFVSAIVELIADRGTTTLPKRVNVFTTNYDSMIELALEQHSIPFNDGFSGRAAPCFDPSTFSRLMCEQSLFMEYVAQVPTVNVLKLHGSLTWRRDGGGQVVYSGVDDTLGRRLAGLCNAISTDVIEGVSKLVVGEFCDGGEKALEEIVSGIDECTVGKVLAFGHEYDSTLCIVNPAKRKFEETLLEQSYYDLLRIYANELDRNNALLLVFGFSFADEHIRELTRRAVRSNPKLMVMVSCYTREDAVVYASYFPNADNVFFIVPEDGQKFELSDLNDVLRLAIK